MFLCVEKRSKAASESLYKPHTPQDSVHGMQEQQMAQEPYVGEPSRPPGLPRLGLQRAEASFFLKPLRFWIPSFRLPTLYPSTYTE